MLILMISYIYLKKTIGKKFADCPVPRKTDGVFKNNDKEILTSGVLVDYNSHITWECNSGHDPFAGEMISTDLKRVCSDGRQFSPPFDDITCKERK